MQSDGPLRFLVYTFLNGWDSITTLLQVQFRPPLMPLFGRSKGHNEMKEFILYVLSTSAVTTIFLSIVAVIAKTAISERIKRAIKHEYETKLKLLDDDLRRKTEIELSKLNNRLSMEIELAKIKLGPYSERQFVIYNELWASLCELKWSMLELWSKASQSNLNKFSIQLFDAHVKLEKSALIFEESHYNELNNLLNIFVDYELGKKTLIEYRNKRAPSPEAFQIQQMIDENREVKIRLLALIPDIRNILRQQIGSNKNAEPVI